MGSSGSNTKSRALRFQIGVWLGYARSDSLPAGLGQDSLTIEPQRVGLCTDHRLPDPIPAIHMTDLQRPSRSKARTALGLICGALVAACTATAMEIVNRNLGGLRDDPLRFSALVPLVFGLFSVLVFLPIVCAVNARVGRTSKAVWVPAIVFSGVAAVIPMLFPGEQPSIIALGLFTLATVGVPLSLSSLVAVHIWRRL